ncbi:MAG: outer membrane protein assembly factor BamA [Rhodospirillaceae bacterium]|nr:outer membrane protein assembly factor BamA [Rhodospirillaceae bacterium]
MLTFPKFFFALSVISLALMHGTSANAQSQGGVITEIVVEGTARVEPETIRSYLLVREGDGFDPLRIDRSLKSLFATGLFADVSIGREGSSLVIKIVENPVINRIAFEGNKRVKDEDLNREISLKPRLVYTRTKVQNDVNRIQEIYRRDGRFAVTVEPKIIQLDQNRIDLVYEINEGSLARVQNIRFIGNDAFDDSDLRDVIRTVETRWYRFLTSDDTYDPDRVSFDKELLRKYYLANGYADFNVLSAVAEMTPNRENFFITFTIEEGERYRFGDITTDISLEGIKPENLKDAIVAEKGSWYNSENVDKTVDALIDEVGTLGHAFVSVTPRPERDMENHTINVVFEVAEGPRVFVERINVIGNSRTLDEVIRREFRLVEGDAFNTAKLSTTIKRINDLDFFKKVDVTSAHGSSVDKSVINVEVEEKSTGALSLGLGYSSDSGPLFNFGVRERNLLGKGQSIDLNASLSGNKSNVTLSFTEPYFMNREVAAGFDIFHSTADNQKTSSYSTTQTGFALRAGYPITEMLKQSWAYTLKSSKVENVKSTASDAIKAQEGTRTHSEVSHVLLYDKRNSTTRPTDGYFLRMNNDLAGLGGDVSYLRNRFTVGHFYSFKKGWTLSTSGSIGIISALSKDLTINDRFFLGGSSLRGFAPGGVGPRDKVTRDSVGGEFIYNGGVDLTVPLGLPPELGISGKAFSDFGSLSVVNPSSTNYLDDGSIRASVGLGMEWVSPIGPLSIEYGIPVAKETYDKTEKFRINFGTRF